MDNVKLPLLNLPLYHIFHVKRTNEQEQDQLDFFNKLIEK